MPKLLLCLLLIAGSVELEAQMVADSIRDFSPTQGQGNWYYGFYTSPFTPETFQPLEVYGTASFGETGWMHTTTPPPWTRLTATVAHPAAPLASSIPIEWAVRRWVSPLDGLVLLTGTFRKNDGGTPSATLDGVTGYIFINGVQAYAKSLAQDDTNGVSFTVPVQVSVGDLVDFALSPNGHDGRDASCFNATIVPVDVEAHWTAFNDHYAGPRTHPNATTWNVFTNRANAPGLGGSLKNIATGAALPVTLTITNHGATGGPTCGTPTNGSPGFGVFNGFTDFGSAPSGGLTNHAIQLVGSNGAIMAFVFTGLNPTNYYSFRGLAVRGDSLYTNRWTICQIIGAASFTNAHSPGVFVNPQIPLLNSEVVFNSGDNAGAGRLVGWDGIRPAANGSFAVTSRQYQGSIPGGTTVGAPYGYGLVALRLSEYLALPTALQISAQPSAVSVQEGEAASLKVVAEGNPLYYQWYLGVAAIPGANQSTLSWDSTQVNDAGSYHVVVTNSSGAATSTVANLTVLRLPQISEPPSSQAAVIGSSVVFQVLASSPTPLKYQWRFYATDLVGKTNQALNLLNVQMSDFGKYSVRVGNDDGVVFSEDALLSQAASPVMTAPSLTQSNISFNFPTETGPTYVLEYKDRLDNGLWQFLAAFDGTGGPQSITDAVPRTGMRFYRVRMQ